jgi:predicted HicB family RNase H-like nuclease
MKKYPDKFAYRVIWSEEDKEYVGLCVELPSLSWLAGSPEEALKGIRTVVRESVADMTAHHEPIPEPISLRHYSGKFIVRVPEEVHRHLALEAAKAGVSLNRLVSEKLG